MVHINFPTHVFQLATRMLWSIGIVVFIKSQYKDKVYYLETASEATGIANRLGMTPQNCLYVDILLLRTYTRIAKTNKADIYLSATVL